MILSVAGRSAYPRHHNVAWLCPFPTHNTAATSSREHHVIVSHPTEAAGDTNAARTAGRPSTNNCQHNTCCSRQPPAAPIVANAVQRNQAGDALGPAHRGPHSSLLIDGQSTSRLGNSTDRKSAALGGLSFQVQGTLHAVAGRGAHDASAGCRRCSRSH